MESAPLRFRWDAAGLPGPFTVVLLEADYRELARFDGIEATVFEPGERLAAPLAAGGVFHCVVIANGDRHPARSPLVSFTAP